MTKPKEYRRRQIQSVKSYACQNWQISSWGLTKQKVYAKLKKLFRERQYFFIRILLGLVTKLDMNQ